MSQIRLRWLKATAGRYCRPRGKGQPYKLIYDVEVATQPSEVYGCIILVYIGGERETLYSDTRKWPALGDIEMLSVQEYYNLCYAPGVTKR